MKCRCFNPNIRDFKNYGGRGITVCDRWKNSFVEFFNDMGLKPGPDYSLDRIDVNGNYEPSNCRWATRKEQVNNRTIRRIEQFTNVQLLKELFSRDFSECPSIS